LSGEVHDLNQTNQPDTVQQMVSYVHVKSAELSLDGVSACIPVSASHWEGANQRGSSHRNLSSTFCLKPSLEGTLYQNQHFAWGQLGVGQGHRGSCPYRPRLAPPTPSRDIVGISLIRTLRTAELTSGRRVLSM